MQTQSRTAAARQQPITQPAHSVLIKLIAAGDETALVRLHNNTSGLLFGLLLRISGNNLAAEAAPEKVYLDIWKRAGEFDAEHQTPLGWIVGIAYHQGVQAVARTPEPPADKLEPLDKETSGDLLHEIDCFDHQQLISSRSTRCRRRSARCSN